MARQRRHFASLPLRHVLTLYKRDRKHAAQGGYGELEPLEAVVSIGHQAAIEPLGGGEQDLAQHRSANARAVIYVRYDPEIIVDRWFVDEATGERWDIHYIENVDQRDEWLVCTCEQAILVPEAQ